MAIPGFHQFMRPYLEELSSGATRPVSEMYELLANRFGITTEDKSETLASGTQPVYVNRIAWARTYLKKAGLIDSPGRAQVCITPLGQRTLKEHEGPIDVRFLKRFPSFIEFQQADRGVSEPGEAGSPPVVAEEQSALTPEEQLQDAFRSLRSALADEIRLRVQECSPEFFERLVVELIVRMGYGGSMADAGKAVGRSGDGGIDGIIKEDRLGLDVIYIQAKRWTDTVGRPDIQKFSGALDGQRARKGIFITTSSFSKEAREFVNMIDKKIILIDGAELSNLMMDFDVGVAQVSNFEVKKLDLDYFEEN